VKTEDSYGAPPHEQAARRMWFSLFAPLSQRKSTELHITV